MLCKKKEIIREDENVCTLKIDCKKDNLCEVLKTFGIQEVYKGDQNLLWDALVTDVALHKAIYPEIPFKTFLHDEKFGTGDHRLVPFYKDSGKYVITEDYAQKITGAVYINQDISYGLFYATPIEPVEYQELGFHLSWIADFWREYKPKIEEDREFINALEELGFSWDYDHISEVTKCGETANKDALYNLFQKNSKAEIYYLFSKSLGWYGVVPKYLEEVSLSSVYIDEELVKHISHLFSLGVRGLLKQVKDKEIKKEIIKRAKKVYSFGKEIIENNKDLSITDFQVRLSQKILSDIFNDDLKVDFSRTSELLRINSISDFEDKDFFFFFNLSLGYPEEFANAYNTALNKAKLPLKRIMMKNNSLELPYFLEVFSLREGRWILTRCNIEVKNQDNPYIRIFSPYCAMETFVSKEDLRSARSFLNTLYSSGKFPYGFALIGKAGPFMTEMRRVPKVLAVPEKGSKYAPMVDYFLGELKRSVNNIPDSHLIRIKLNFLDNLRYLGKIKFSLPKFLSLYFSKQEMYADEISSLWREKVEEVSKVLNFVSGIEAGEYFHLGKIILYEKGLLEDLGKSKKFFDKLKEKGYDNIFRDFPFSNKFLSVLKDLIEERDKVIEEIRKKKKEASSQLHQERHFVEYKIILLFGALLRSLFLFKESLSYLNFRPYSIMIYLVSPDFFKVLTDNAEIYLEKVEFKT
ncbi:MAG TPA: hypothetical protein PKW23_00360 [Dictyoglomaceae bacterium]|nr:hypothetical protein [Dictyoglomaceae bacterium]HOL39188.1 hypothetical protein [Dictyoglomaceae bacterium]HPP15342.1 hypothetical protein [Dictyoglomaceae bacterium]HPU43612.1 hypothetical protein [Dictyoglomaceae bacterium]